jgi:CheY-like chemotaxis protein
LNSHTMSQCDSELAARPGKFVATISSRMPSILGAEGIEGHIEQIAERCAVASGADDVDDDASEGALDDFKPRILVVDDSAMNRRVLCRLLEQAGYDTVQASDGLAAVAAISRVGVVRFRSQLASTLPLYLGEFTSIDAVSRPPHGHNAPQVRRRSTKQNPTPRTPRGDHAPSRPMSTSPSPRAEIQSRLSHPSYPASRNSSNQDKPGLLTPHEGNTPRLMDLPEAILMDRYVMYRWSSERRLRMSFRRLTNGAPPACLLGFTATCRA